VLLVDGRAKFGLRLLDLFATLSSLFTRCPNLGKLSLYGTSLLMSDLAVLFYHITE
jgi:hypothetical protein